MTTGPFLAAVLEDTDGPSRENTMLSDAQFISVIVVSFSARR
jgi:hypothetical protein